MIYRTQIKLYKIKIRTLLNEDVFIKLYRVDFVNIAGVKNPLEQIFHLFQGT